MSRGEYFASRPTFRPAARGTAVLLIAALAGGCDGTPSGGNGTEGELAVPTFVASSRAIDTGRLSVTLSVGNDDVPVRESGGVWTATFDLPDDSEQTFPIEVVWFYAVTGRADPIPIARADRQISLADSRRLRVSGYVTEMFDADGDLVDNFTEIDRGTDPLGPGGEVEPNADQADCRETVLPGERTEDVEAERDLFRFGATEVDDTFSVDFDIEQIVYHATLAVGVPGTITIEHRSGLPTNTNALLYDRRAGAVGFEGSATVLVTANPSSTADGIPARVSARIVRPGLYCYALFDELGADFADGAVLSDIVLQIRFTPDTP